MKLKAIKKKRSGRSQGQVTVRHKGGEHKKFLRFVDFKRNKIGIVGKVVGFEYDPNRNVDLALIQYQDGERRYILRPQGLYLNDQVASGPNVEAKVGNALPLSRMPIGTVVHNVELTPGGGGKLARGAGTYAVVAANEGNYVHLKLPSGELRRVRSSGFATVGSLSNEDFKNKVFGKAGRKRHIGVRPTVRGVAQNPRSHPHGGGEGRSGIGMPAPKTYKGRPAVGKTRKKKKYSDKYILERRKR